MYTIYVSTLCYNIASYIAIAIYVAMCSVCRCQYSDWLVDKLYLLSDNYRNSTKLYSYSMVFIVQGLHERVGL